MAQNVFFGEGSGGTIVAVGSGTDTTENVPADFVTGGSGVYRGNSLLSLSDLSAPDFRWLSKPYTPAGEAGICLFRRLYFAIRHNAGFCFKVRPYVDGTALYNKESSDIQDFVAFESAPSGAGTSISYVEVPVHGRGTSIQVLLQTGRMDPVIAIDSTAEKFKITNEVWYQIAGTTYRKAATTGLTFSSADTINTGAASGTYWGVWLVQANSDGTVGTKSPSSDQVYASEAAAIAALPSPDSGYAKIGYITVNSSTGVDWVANTDDLTDGSDCTEANFYSTEYNTPGEFSLEGFAIGFKRERNLLLDKN